MNIVKHHAAGLIMTIFSAPIMVAGCMADSESNEESISSDDQAATNVLYTDSTCNKNKFKIQLTAGGFEMGTAQSFTTQTIGHNHTVYDPATANSTYKMYDTTQVCVDAVNNLRAGSGNPNLNDKYFGSTEWAANAQYQDSYLDGGGVPVACGLGLETRISISPSSADSHFFKYKLPGGHANAIGNVSQGAQATTVSTTRTASSLVTNFMSALFNEKDGAGNYTGHAMALRQTKPRRVRCGLTIVNNKVHQIINYWNPQDIAGASCGGNLGCLSNSCQSGVCAKGGTGRYCMSNNDCSSGLTCTTGTSRGVTEKKCR